MPRDLPVTQVMTADPVTVLGEESVEDAVRTLVDAGVSGAPVVDAGGRLVGLLDDADLILSEARLHAPTTVELFGAYLTLPGQARRYEDEIRHALGRTVAEVMHRNPPHVTPRSTVEDVATLMLERDVSRIPVVDDDKRVVGIVTRGDLVKAIGRQGR